MPDAATAAAPPAGAAGGRAVWWGVAAAVLIGGAYVLGAALATHGRLDSPFDDAFIFFQFAKNTARGYVMTYQVGEGPTAGCTSLAWMLYLALGWGVGFRGALLSWFSTLSGVALLALAAAFAYRLVKHAGGSTSGAVLASLAVALAGPAAYAFLSGTETALFATLALAAIYYGVRRATGRFAAAAAILTWVRPEAAALALALGAWYALAAGGPKKRLAPLLVIPAAAVAWGVAMVATTGGLTTNSYYAKSPLAAYDRGNRPPDYYRLVLWAEPVAALRTEVASAFGYVQRYNVLEAKPADGLRFGVAVAEKVTSRFLGRPAIWAGMALGLVVAAARSRRLAAACAVAAASLLVVNAVALGGEHFMYHRGRYGVPMLLPALVLAAFGLDWLSRKTTKRSWPAFALLAALAPATVAWGVSFVVDEGFVHRFYGAAAAFVERELGPRAVIATHDAGYLAYYTPNRIIDLGGLGARRYAGAARAGDGAVVEVLERERPAPTHLFLYPGMLPAVESTVAGEPLPLPADAPEEMVSYGAFYPALLAGCNADVPRTPPPGKRLADALDVADADAERAHGYRCGNLRTFEVEWKTVFADGQVRGRAESRRSGRAYATRTTYAGGGATVVDAGRLIGEWEEFELAGRPGRDAILVTRTDRPGAAVALYVNGVFAGRQEWDGPPADTWREAAFVVPGRLLRGRDRFRVQPVGPRGLGFSYTSFHYWLYQ